MNRYIDADDVIKAVDKHTNNDGVLDDDITCILEEIPTASYKILDDIKTEILKQVLDEPPKDGTNGEMCCYNSGLFLATEIIDKYISGTVKLFTKKFKKSEEEE